MRDDTLPVYGNGDLCERVHGLRRSGGGVLRAGHVRMIANEEILFLDDGTTDAG